LGVADLDTPPEPSFAVAAPGDGALVLASIGFSILENTQTISTGTFQLWFRDELAAPGAISLASTISETDTTATLSAAGPAQAGDLVQIEEEVLRVIDVQGAGTQYELARGQCGSSAAAHAGGMLVRQLQLRSVIVPFQRSFFGTLASGGWAHSEPLPGVRLVCAELWLTNAFGQSPVGANSYASLPDGGLRTLHGGQFNFQVEGLLGAVNDAVPVVSVQQALSIRDVYAFVKEAPTGAALQLRINQDGNEVTTFSIAAGQTVSTPVSGASLPALQALANLTLDIVTVGTSYPGRDLTVTIRV
jgi:hypothetical protein